MKTEYLLYIYANTQYKCTEGDALEFNAAVESLTGKISYASPNGMFDGSNYLGAYVFGMYPELEKPVAFFKEEIYKYKATGISDNLMKLKALTAISKFGLKRDYDFDKEPNAEQFQRINTSVRKLQQHDLINYASPLFRDMGLALMQSERDYRPIHQFIEKINLINKIVSGKYPEKMLKNNININGVSEGLALLALKKQGIISDKLEIADIDKFCNTKIVKEFSIGGKSYDLSDVLRQMHNNQINNFKNRKETSLLNT